MADRADLSHAMGLAPKEALDFLRAKGFKWPGGPWTEVWESAHSRAFTVAHMARFDLLAETRRIVDRKLAEGLTAEQASKELMAAFKRKGWVGKEIRVGADGAARAVRLGSPARARLIVRTNAATAYAAGRFRRQKEDADSRPIWRYVAVLDASTRPSHAALDGQAWRHDDPIWESIYPPNGFNCRCRVQALTEDQAADRGGVTLNPRSARAAKRVGPPEDAAVPDVTEARWRTPGGKVRRFRPDPGWGYNPGAVVQPPRPVSPKLIKGPLGPKDYGRPEILTPREDMPKLLARASSQQEAYQAVLDELGLTGATTWRKIQTPVGAAGIKRSTAWHIVEKEDGREQFGKTIIPTLTDPDEVWMAQYEGGEVRLHYVKVWRKEDGKSGGSFAVSAENDRLGNMIITFLPMSRRLNAQRTGWLLHPVHPAPVDGG